MRESHNRPVMPFQSTIGSLALAPLGGIVVFVLDSIATRQYQAPDLMMVLVIVAALSYATAAVLVVPVLIILPAARQPPLWVAATWGICVALAAQYGPLLFRRLLVLEFTGFDALLIAAGAASGLVFGVAARKASESARTEQ